VLKKLTRSISALGAVFFAAVGLSACGGIPGDAVVQVGGTPITNATFAHWMSIAAASSAASSGATGAKPVVPDPPNFAACIAHLEATQPKPTKGQTAPTKEALKSQCALQYKALQQEVLGYLISAQWVIGEAADLGIHVSDKEVKKRFEQIRSSQFPKQAEFEKFLATSGQTTSDLLLRVKLSLLSSKIQQKIAKSKSNITQAQITKYYNENQQRFAVPEHRNVGIILAKTEGQALAAKREIQSGKSFATVAKTASIDPVSKANGGLLTEVVKGQEERALDSAIFSASPHVLSGPVKTPFGYYVFEVKSTAPASKQTLAQAQASIRQQLVATGQQAALTKFVKEFKTKWTGRTECRAGYMVMDCKGYKAPKTGATGAT
jgi:foldase protein PrsA